MRMSSPSEPRITSWSDAGCENPGIGDAASRVKDNGPVLPGRRRVVHPDVESTRLQMRRSRIDWPCASRAPCASYRSATTPVDSRVTTSSPVRCDRSLEENTTTGLSGLGLSRLSRSVTRVSPASSAVRTALVRSTSIVCVPLTVERFLVTTVLAAAVASRDVGVPSPSASSTRTSKVRLAKPASASRWVPAAVPSVSHTPRRPAHRWP